MWSSRHTARGSRAAVLVVALGAVAWSALPAPTAAAASGDLTISSTSLAFPRTPVGDLSSDLAVTIANNTGSPVASGVGGGALASGTNFIYDGENCPTTLNPGDTCAATYQFSPKSVNALSDSATLTVQGHSITIRVTGTGVPDFSVGPTALVFPDTVVGFTTPMQSVVLTNVSAQAHSPSLAGGALFHHTDFATDGQTCGSVPPGGTCAFRYHFAPTTVGSLDDGTTIGVDGINYPITLAGKGITGIDVTPTTLAFPDTPVGNLSSTMDVTLTNVSTQVLHPGIGGGALTTGTDFVYDGENCPSALAPGAACQATYQFAPKSPGRHTDTATLMVSGGTVVIALVGGHGSTTTATPPTTTPATTHQVTTHPGTTRTTIPVTQQAAPTTTDSTAGPGGVASTSGSETGTSTTASDETPSSATAAGATGSSATGSATQGQGSGLTSAGVLLAGSAGSSQSGWLWVWMSVAVIAVAGLGVGAYALGRRRQDPSDR
jgi:hypothetical protein